MRLENEWNLFTKGQREGIEARENLACEGRQKQFSVGLEQKLRSHEWQERESGVGESGEGRKPEPHLESLVGSRKPQKRTKGGP